MNPGGRGCSEPRLHHRTPAWGREGEREEGRKEGGKEGGREGGREGRREGGKEGELKTKIINFKSNVNIFLEHNIF